MTQISGKIYQMKNAAGTENRFPRTVMEAVYGLSTYLQDQFSALADIYMPIEGITESKTGQEFVYRQSAATIKAKSLTLDRIYGKTLAWNQLVKMPTASSSVGWEQLTNPVYNSDGSFTLTPPADWVGGVYLENVAVVGHKYLVSLYLQCTDIMRVFYGGVYVTENSVDYSTKTKIKKIISASEAYMLSLWGTANAPATFWDIQIIDLTLLYGSEIDGMTDEQILAKFESDFPGYHDFGNKLISNDAESLETTGFNKWDEEWENGYWSGSVGETPHFNSGGTYLSSKNIIPVFPNTAYYIKGPNETLRVVEVDSSGEIIKLDYADSNSIYTTQSNCVGLLFSCWNTPTYNNDICINLSDPAKNGTYEPYRKTTLQLGLNNFKVKSHNIWDEQWELGTFDTITGEPYSSTTQIRSKEPIHILPNTDYYCKVPAGMWAMLLDYNGNVIPSSEWSGGLYEANNCRDISNSIFHTANNAAWLKFYVIADYGATYQNDICINVSSSFNGQYEPHGDIAITGGLKGDGTWADILYSNNHLTNKAKRVNLWDLDWIITYDSQSNVIFYTDGLSSLIKPTLNDSLVGNIICSIYSTRSRDGEWGSGDNMVIAVNSSGYIFVNNYSYTDAATFKAAMDGVYLDYELATPIEYELVEPLVYSMAAGTTEARISPNSDGLSAPFYCDMTYDANANNDSANAQYALTAGRLYNTHKLWGQDFDGSNDVSGALSGVTTIGASGNITTAAQLISTVATGTAPLSVASTTEVANLHSYTATKLHTQRTLWGQNFDGSGNVTGDMSNVGNIAFSASGKNIASLLYFDTTYSRVGVGASSPAYKLDVNGTLNASGAATFGSTLGVTGNSTLDGTVRIGGSSGATLTYVSANSGLSLDKGLYSLSYLTAGAASASSDERLKTNITDFDKAISMLLLIKPREWDWNDKTSLEGHCAGFVAQEVQSIIPYAVETHGEYLSLNYNVFHALEVSALQNHESRIEMLESENQRLRDEIANLTN